MEPLAVACWMPRCLGLRVLALPSVELPNDIEAVAQKRLQNRVFRAAADPDGLVR